MSPTGRPLVAVGDTAPGVTVMVADQGTALARKPIPGTLTAIKFANRGESVVAAGSAIVLLFSVVGDRQWKTDNLGTVNALAVGGADDDWIAVTSGKTASLLATSDGHPRWASPAAHPRAVTRIAVDRGGRWVATGCADRRTRLFDAATGELTHETEARLGGVLALGATVDGSIVVSGNEDGEVLLIDTANPASDSRSVPGNFACRHVGISSDGTLLAIGRDDNSVAIHDISVVDEPPLLQRWTYPAPVTAGIRARLRRPGRRYRYHRSRTDRRPDGYRSVPAAPPEPRYRLRVQCRRCTHRHRVRQHRAGPHHGHNAVAICPAQRRRWPQRSARCRWRSFSSVLPWSARQNKW